MEKTTDRSSNIELFRILLMLIIIANHYVVNSGTTSLYDYAHISASMVFLQIFGFGGKMAINCFLLISGYFMILAEYDKKKLIRLYAEIKFYKIVLWLFFLAIGYETFSLGALKNYVFSVIYSIGYGRSFPEVYLVLYLLIPYINILVKALDQKQLEGLLGILLFYFSVISTIFAELDTIQYLGWFITVYMIGCYIRLYPNKYTESKRFGFCGALATFLFIVLTILFVDFCRHRGIGNIKNYYYWAIDCHKIGCIMLSAFYLSDFPTFISGRIDLLTGLHLPHSVFC